MEGELVVVNHCDFLVFMHMEYDPAERTFLESAQPHPNAPDSSLFQSTRQLVGYVHPDPPREFAGAVWSLEVT